MVVSSNLATPTIPSWTDKKRFPPTDIRGGNRACLGQLGQPTAGLDPAERVRFRPLLANLAADRVVILFTHIVEDVAATCRYLAVHDGTHLRIVGSKPTPEATEATPGLEEGYLKLLVDRVEV